MRGVITSFRVDLACYPPIATLEEERWDGARGSAGSAALLHTEMRSAVKRRPTTAVAHRSVPAQLKREHTDLIGNWLGNAIRACRQQSSNRTVGGSDEKVGDSERYWNRKYVSSIAAAYHTLNAEGEAAVQVNIGIETSLQNLHDAGGPRIGARKPVASK